MRAFAYHFSFEFFTGLRNKTLLLMMYLLPLGFHFMMGLMMVDINPFFLETMIPAMVIFAVLSGMILGLPQPLVEAREAGIFRSYKINGVPAASILAIPALSALIHASLASLVIVVTGSLVFQAPVPGNWPAFALVFLVLALNCSGLGVLIGVVSSSSRITVLWSQLIYLPSMMAGGLMVPLQLLPAALMRVARLLPASYAMDAFKGLAMGMPGNYNPAWALLILGSSAVLAFALALYLFSWDSKNTTRRSPLLGLLVLLPFILGMLFLPLGERMDFFSAIF
jgi:ABC-2 type transport system permease protein